MAESKKNETLINELAIATAIGADITRWSATHGITDRTARRWAKSPGFDGLVQEHRRVLVGAALGKLTSNAEKAVGTIAKRLDSADERISLAAAGKYLDVLIRMHNHAELDRRMAVIEAQARAAKKKGQRQ
jgi:hypothetical protein